MAISASCFVLSALSSVHFRHSIMSDSLQNPWATGYRMPGFPVHHQLPELAQTHVHRSVMPSNHLTLCHLLLLLPSIIPSIRGFFNESVLCIRWWKFATSASASVLAINIQDWFPLGWTGWILQSKGLSRVFSNLGPNYGGGNDDNGDLPQKIPCMYCYSLCPQPCSRPTLTHAFTGDSWTHTGKSPVGSLFLSPGSWCTRFCWALQESISQSYVSLAALWWG